MKAPAQAGIITQDFDETNLHSFNRYAYGNNNPYKFVDPDGNAPTPVDAYFVGHSGGELIASVGLYVYGKVARDTGLAEVAGAAILPSAFSLAQDVAGLAGPPGANAARRVVRAADNAGDAAKITTPYTRPSGATTKAQREAVQGQPCVECGAITPRQVADHKTPLVKEYYETGKIDTQRMHNLESVQPHCPTCSARQGADLSRFSRQKREEHGL